MSTVTDARPLCEYHNKPICIECGYCIEDVEHLKHVRDEPPRSNFDQVFTQMSAPDYPSTCDNCGEAGTNASMEGHECVEQAETPAGRRLDFHIAENMSEPATLLIEEESGETVARFPISERGQKDCIETVKRWNSHAALVAALRDAGTWLVALSLLSNPLNGLNDQIARIETALKDAGEEI